MKLLEENIEEKFPDIGFDSDFFWGEGEGTKGTDNRSKNRQVGRPHT